MDSSCLRSHTVDQHERVGAGDGNRTRTTSLEERAEVQSTRPEQAIAGPAHSPVDRD